MIAYKLFRELKEGDVTSLFINKKERLPFKKWIKAKSYPTKGYAFRPYWHCTENPEAPHLSSRNRVWIKVEIKDYEIMNRPKSQGGKWFLAKNIRLLEKINIKK